MSTSIAARCGSPPSNTVANTGAPSWCPGPSFHDLKLVHRLRHTQASSRGSRTRLWPISRATTTRYITELMAAAGIEGPQASAKGLRHAWGVAAVAPGVPLPTVAAVPGHASLSTTAIYTTAIGAEEE